MSTASPAAASESAPRSLPASGSKNGAGRRKHNAAEARAELLEIATAEFARNGYYGARVDEIADQSSISKRMIYYYFGDKDGLFTAVLERAYADIRTAELALDLSHLSPVDAISKLIEHTFAWHATRPQLAKVIAAENSLGAVHVRQLTRQVETNLPILQLLDEILTRGRAEGSFRRTASALDLHLQMTALALFQVTNAATVEATFGVQLRASESIERVTRLLTSMVLTWLANPDPEPSRINSPRS